MYISSSIDVVENVGIGNNCSSRSSKDNPARENVEINSSNNGRSQNTVPIASTQVAIKGIVQYSTRAQFLVEQLATRHS